MTESNEQTCRCGYTQDHPWVVPKHKYSLWGWIIVGVGISYAPKEITVECDKCGEVFESINEKEILLKNKYK